MDDAQLLARLRTGDEVAFRELVRRYHSVVVRVARYYVRSDASANDVAQETWLAVIRGVERFEGRSSFKTWLLRIAANRARTLGAKESRLVAVDFSNDEASVPAGRFTDGGMWRTAPEPFSDGLDQSLTNAPLIELVHGAIARLDDPYRAVVTLRDAQGLSTTEVAKVLDLSEANVRVILHRGRARVRAEVEAKMPQGRDA